MPNIAIITGTRAEFGIWTPVLRAVQQSKKLKLQLIVTGMHLQKEFSNTVDDIIAAKIPIAAKVPMYLPNDTPADALARGVSGMAAAFEKLRPDLVMVLGDRLEILAAANAALACQIPLAHLHGGETAPGQWDEQIRHAVTKMAHLHFCATKKAGERIAQMGEDPKTIHVVGAPALDGILHWLKTTRPAYNRGKRAIVLLHPCSADDRLEERRARKVIGAVRARKNIPYVVIGPNNDPGCRGILRAYKKMGVNVAMSLPTQDFWNHLKYGGILVGNSSSGILEAASFGIPVINLGDRQKGRERNSNVLDVPWSAGEAGIRNAIRFALTNEPFRRRVGKRQNLYGDGQAASRIVKVLESLKFPLPTTKLFRDR